MGYKRLAAEKICTGNNAGNDFFICRFGEGRNPAEWFREIAVNLNEYGTLEFWEKMPLNRLDNWIRVINRKIAKQNAEIKAMRRR